MKVEVDLKYLGEGKMCLHTQIGEGTLNGRKIRFIMNNGGVWMQVTNAPDKWDSYAIDWSALSEAIANTILLMEEERNKVKT